jgi:hypothetical protein
MIEVVFALLLYTSAEEQPIEYTPYENLSECLMVKRKIKRNISGGSDFDQRWQCKQLMVEMEQSSDGSWHITKLMEDAAK